MSIYYIKSTILLIFVDGSTFVIKNMTLYNTQIIEQYIFLDRNMLKYVEITGNYPKKNFATGTTSTTVHCDKLTYRFLYLDISAGNLGTS